MAAFLEVLLVLAGFIIAMLFVLFIHEIGHGLMALKNGGTFLFLTIGPVSLTNEEGKIRPSLNTNVAYYGGVISVTGPKHTENLRRKYFLYILGGPLLSLILGTVCLLLSHLFKANDFVSFPLLLIGMMSTSIGIMTSLPFSLRATPLTYNDGKRLYECLKKTELAENEFLGWKNATGLTPGHEALFSITECEKLKNSCDPIDRYVGSYCLAAYYELQQPDKFTQECLFFQSAIAELKPNAQKLIVQDETAKKYLAQS